MSDQPKSISESRDRLQSRLLVWLVGAPLALACLPLFFQILVHKQDRSFHLALWAGLVSLTFGVVVWALRAATPAAAFFGAAICFQVTAWTSTYGDSLFHSGLTPLMALFVLTFLATKAGKSRKPPSGSVELRSGRNAAQIIANLGAAGLAIYFGFLWSEHLFKSSDVILLGVLAEATADTVSSELGAAFGGQPYLLTTLRPVPPGTDGAISLLGTAAGALAAAIVAAIGMAAMSLTPREAAAGFLGGLVGLFFDSLLGATLERRGWLGNDLVNFFSTCIGGVTALALALST